MVNQTHMHRKSLISPIPESELPLQSADKNDAGLQNAIRRPDKTTLTPDNVLQLQGLIGNQAVMQLMQQSNPQPKTNPIPRIRSASTPGDTPIQTARFKNDEVAITWLVEVLNTILAAKRQRTPANYTEDKMDTYLGSLSDSLIGVLPELLTKKGGDFAEEKDYHKNLNTLYNPEVTNAAIARIRAAESTHHFGAKKRTIDAHALEHIFLGTVDNVDNPTKVTGYHWEGDDTAVAEGYGAKMNEEAKFGLYQKGVRSRAKTSVTKANVSTFFPTTWTRENITAAIEYANDVSGTLEANYPSKARGLRIVKNDAGYFPDAPENQPK